MKAGILNFPGINCERDLLQILRNEYSATAELLDYRESFQHHYDIYFVPGGFSYGDYLRSGALAARARSLDSLRDAAQKGAPIVGICNGFQILTEAGLLPGALIRNKTLKHICRWVGLKGSGDWANQFEAGYSLPVSHGEGNYICDADVLHRLQDENRILLQYAEDINGSTEQIACIADTNKKIIGLMPHPERAILPSLDSLAGAKKYGQRFFELVFQQLGV
ncbi:MAG: phosphoribosylformylglycinamidine synthase subunit PurQ [Leptospiraceae bacterium]|nr:phosphoribosylformylglycinamidine synthase subunit PurQ [Leptospiraceae bacterium]